MLDSLCLQFLRGEKSQAGIDGNHPTDGIDRWKLTRARRVDANGHRGARADPVIVGVDMCLAAIERGMRRHRFDLRGDAIVLVRMDLSAVLVEGRHESQQPAREQPSAADDASAKPVRRLGWREGAGRETCAFRMQSSRWVGGRNDP